MKKRSEIVCMAALAVLVVSCIEPADADDDHSAKMLRKSQDSLQSRADRLYEAVKQSRQELRQTRILAGLHPHPAGPHIDPEGHHANDGVSQRDRERIEGEGHEDRRDKSDHTEPSKRGHREEERTHEERDREDRATRERSHKGGDVEHRKINERASSKISARIGRTEKHLLTYRNGARLSLQYNPRTQAFAGKVTNNSKHRLQDVRVEIHLSNGTELGPTKRTDLVPGQTIPIELGAFGQEFTHWTTHPESGNEEAHGAGNEENERTGGHRNERSGLSDRERRGNAEREGGEHDRERTGHAERERAEHIGGQALRRHGVDSEGGHGVGHRSMGPVFNQLQILRGEIHAFQVDIQAKTKDR